MTRSRDFAQGRSRRPLSRASPDRHLKNASRLYHTSFLKGNREQKLYHLMGQQKREKDHGDLKKRRKTNISPMGEGRRRRKNNAHHLQKGQQFTS